MKLLITKSEPHEEDSDYYVIDKFEKFMELTKDEIASVDEIKMADYLLSMSCFYWLIDFDLSALGHIHFVIPITDKERSNALWICIRKYMHKYKKLNQATACIPEDS